MFLFVDIEKKLGNFRLKVKLEAENEVLALLGASGSGKSMTLKCIAGIERPDRGRIVVDGVTLFDSEKRVDLPPQVRQTGFLFQNYALFPNMTVVQNIRAGARREPDKAKREAAVHRTMESFGLAELAGYYPHQLSGGQQQRTALARILVSAPRILLLDEPFSALDSHLRFRLEQELRQNIRDFGKTVLLVSHDRDEVFRLADSVAVLNEGRVETAGTKKAVFAAPRTKNAAQLTGCKNISRLERRGPGRVYALDWGMELAVNDNEKASHLGIRMHSICPGAGENSFVCRVVEEIENPFSVTVMLRPEGRENAVPLGWEMEKDVWQSLRAEKVRVCLPKESVLLLED